MFETTVVNPVLYDNHMLGTKSSFLNSTVKSISNLIKPDNITSGNFSKGSIPSVKPGFIGKISSSNFIQGAKTATSAAVNSTISAGRNVGNIIANEVLPKPEPVTPTLLRNRFLSIALVGGMINGIKGVIKVAKGEVNHEEALQTVIKDTALGVVGGLSFAGGMGATASVLGKVITGVPLSIAGLTFGALASIGIMQLIKATIPAFADN